MNKKMFRMIAGGCFGLLALCILIQVIQNSFRGTRSLDVMGFIAVTVGVFIGKYLVSLIGAGVITLLSFIDVCRVIGDLDYLPFGYFVFYLFLFFAYGLLAATALFGMLPKLRKLAFFGGIAAAGSYCIAFICKLALHFRLPFLTVAADLLFMGGAVLMGLAISRMADRAAAVPAAAAPQPMYYPPQQPQPYQQPFQPAYQQPAQPQYQAPQAPAQPQWQPQYPAPAEPAAYAPQPAVPLYPQAPAEPRVYQAPVQDQYQAPAEPVYPQAPVQDQYQAPAQPQAYAPVEPQAYAPAEPQAYAPAEPQAYAAPAEPQWQPPVQAPVYQPAAPQPAASPYDFSRIRVRYCCTGGHVFDGEEGLTACPTCGAPLPGGGFIQLYRMGNPMGAAVGMGVYIDDIPFGHLANKQSIRISVPFGPHKVHVTHTTTRKCNDPVYTVTPEYPYVWCKAHFTKGGFAIEVEQAAPSEMPT